MGKIKKNGRQQRAAQRNSPYGLLTVKEIETKLSTEDAKKFKDIFGSKDISPDLVLQQLNNQDSVRRVTVCDSLAFLSSKDAKLSLKMFSKEVFQKILSLLSTDTYDVRLSCIGTLRNLTNGGNEEIISELLGYKCLDIALKLMSEIIPLKDVGFANVPWIAEPKQIDDILQHLVGVIWNFCEANNEANSYFTLNPLLSSVTNLLNLEKYPVTLVLTVAQCLAVVTDNNRDCGSFLQQGPGFSVLPDWAGSRPTLASPYPQIELSVLANTILFNIGFAKENDLVSLTLPLLTHVLKQDVCSTFPAVMTAIKHSDEMYKDKQKNAMSLQTLEDFEFLAEKRQIPEEMKQWRACLRAQCAALELLANIYAGEDEFVDVQVEDEMAEDDPASENLTPGAQLPEFSQSLVDFAVSNCLPDLLLSVVLSTLPALPAEFVDDPLIASCFQMLNRDFLRMKINGSACLGNFILLTASSGQLTDPTAIWNALYALSSQLTDAPSQDFLAQNVQTLNVLCKCAYAVRKDVVPTPEQFEGVLLLLSTGSAAVACAGVGILGYFARRPDMQGNEDALTKIGRVLSAAISANEIDPNLELLCEVLDIVYDVFAEPTHNSVVRTVNLMSALRSILPRITHFIKTKRRFLSQDMLVRLDEHRLNISRLLKYKRSQPGI
eukprot:GCRY01003115.1.p1 GENE.GCRY01003115.1~~GCRY01003115.1.p1  ORF type:complete len:698 (-),score=134.06 GCRY01003115.1:35-2026(-)